MNEQVTPHKQLNSRESFLGACEPLTKIVTDRYLKKWKEVSTNPDMIKGT